MDGGICNPHRKSAASLMPPDGLELSRSRSRRRDREPRRWSNSCVSAHTTVALFATSAGLDATWLHWRRLPNVLGSPDIRVRRPAVGGPAYPTVRHDCVASVRRVIESADGVRSAPLCALAEGPAVFVGTEGPTVAVWNRRLSAQASLHAGARRVTAIHVSDAAVLTAHDDRRLRLWPRGGRTTRKNTWITLPRREAAVVPSSWDSFWARRVLGGSSATSSDATHAGPITGIAESPRFLYTSSEDGTVRVWKRPQHRHVDTLRAQVGPVHAVAAPSNGSGMVFTAGSDACVRIWRTDRGSLLHVSVTTLKVSRGRSTSAVRCLALAPDGLAVYGGMNDGDVNAWELRGIHVDERGHVDDVLFLVDSVHSGVMRGHTQAVVCVVLVQNLVFSASVDSTVRIWTRNPESTFYVCLQIIRTTDGPLKALLYLPNQEDPNNICLYSVSHGGTLRLWSVRKIEKLFE